MRKKQYISCINASFLPLFKNSYKIPFSSCIIKNSSHFSCQFFGNSIFLLSTYFLKEVCKILGHCPGAEQLPDQIFGKLFELDQNVLA